jgi:Fe-S-cluster containining protein
MRSDHPTARGGFPPAAFERLEALYAELDRVVAAAAPRCDLSGRCCDFESSDHVLFATELEAHYLLDRSGAWAPNGPLCPFWKSRLCSARHGRPLGCRIYFCDPAHRDRMPALYERFQARIRAIHDEHGLEYRYAPLVDTLRRIHDERLSRDSERAVDTTSDL